MHIKSTFSSSTAKPANIPVSILALQVRTGSHPSTPAGPCTTVIADRAFVHLPDTFSALVSLTRTSFRLPPCGVLQFTTDMLDVCRGAQVRITESVYGLLRGMLDSLSVEVVEDDNGEGENQSKSQWKGRNGGLRVCSARPEKIDGSQKEGKGDRREDELDSANVFAADGAQQSEQSLSIASSNTFVKQPSHDISTLSTEPTTPDPRASPSSAAVPVSASGSLAPLPLQSPPPITPLAIGPPDDPTNFVIYISGPNTTHETTFVTCSKHPVSKVLLAARSHFEWAADDEMSGQRSSVVPLCHDDGRLWRLARVKRLLHSLCIVPPIASLFATTGALVHLIADFIADAAAETYLGVTATGGAEPGRPLRLRPGQKALAGRAEFVPVQLKRIQAK
ncbi:hypothetical protein BD779DRAFT_1674571 [Infundibulicybe gibba]|nr:hypothetical protein BD779DRAFT_1674571 [Infundibulicybe gibba]